MRVRRILYDELKKNPDDLKLFLVMYDGYRIFEKINVDFKKTLSESESPYLMSDTDDESLRKQIRDFASRYDMVYRIARQADVEIERALSPRFSVFEYMDPDENKISKIIADLLNPFGRHGQGEVFLKAFLELIHKNFSCDEHNERSLINTKITTEASTDAISRMGRMDILLENDDDKWVLAIENKPEAREQQDQMRNYSDHLERNYQNGWSRHLVFLSGSNAS